MRRFNTKIGCVDQWNKIETNSRFFLLQKNAFRLTDKHIHARLYRQRSAWRSDTGQCWFDQGEQKIKNPVAIVRIQIRDLIQFHNVNLFLSESWTVGGNSRWRIAVIPNEPKSKWRRTVATSTRTRICKCQKIEYITSEYNVVRWERSQPLPLVVSLRMSTTIDPSYA